MIGVAMNATGSSLCVNANGTSSSSRRTGALRSALPLRPSHNRPSPAGGRGAAFRNYAISPPSKSFASGSAEATDVPGKISSSSTNSGAGVLWKCTIRSPTPLLGDTGTRLELVVIDRISDERSAVFSVDSWRPPSVYTTSDGLPGWQRDGSILLPSGTVPGAVLVRKLPEVIGNESKDYIAEIDLISPDAVHHISAHSWVSTEHGWRVFFSGMAYLPKDTPSALLDERQRELEELQGTPETRVKERKGADRIYWYQVYNDLSTGKTGKLVRPVLGDSKALPYPRRLATNRGNEPDGREKPPADGKDLWLQLDEEFSAYKLADFQGPALQGILTTAVSLISEASNNKTKSPITLVPAALLGIARQKISKLIPGSEAPLDNFEDFEDVLAMYMKDVNANGGLFASLKPTKLYPPGAKTVSSGADGHSKDKPFKTADGAWDFQLDDQAAAKLDEVNTTKRMGSMLGDQIAAEATAGADGKPAAGGKKPSLGGKAQRILQERLGLFMGKVKEFTSSINDLFYFPVPRVLDARPDAWFTDEEFGRQRLAGVNPCQISALKVLPETLGSAITADHVNPELQGATLEQLVADAAAGKKPRLFWLDYWDMGVFWGQDTHETAVQHAGRALFYLRKDEAGNDAALVPVAIELAHPGTHEASPGLKKSAGIVYYRSVLANDPKTLAVWRLAKMVFGSIDAVYHQLVSHWNRTHCVLEPFFISMRRNVSAMHPVFKLMAPHFRYTLTINRNARQSLINTAGIIEKSFSIGPHAMPLASKVYGKDWNFATQAVPDDLRARGMVDSEGKPWTDYPYAADGLEMWRELTNYFDSYLRLYYKSDQDVVEDPELQAWWHEAKTEGHPDLIKFNLRTEEQLWGFKGPIPSISKLVHVLATIAWLSSGHHAAVNFGQYDYTSLILNTSSLIRRPMPAPGQKAYAELTGAAPGTPQEGVIMTYLSDPLTAMMVTSTVKLLSSHARDEHTLDEPNHFLVDPAAREANQRFIEAMHRLNTTIETRNVNPANWARFGLKPGTDSPMPYTLLVPASAPGVTMRGVPYSVSI